jgi:hypothetical protein
MYTTESPKCIEVSGTKIGWVMTGPFREEFEIKILLHIHLVQHIDLEGIFRLISPTRYYTFLTEVLGQLRLAWIKMSLHTRLQISHDCSLLCGTDEISLAITVRSSEQLVGKVYALAIDMEKCISLNRLKSLSKFIRVCQSKSCFWLTTSTTIHFQCGFTGKSAFLV